MPDIDDSNWKANGRPISTIARTFSAALDDAFSMTPELANLSQSIAQKEQSVSSQKSELEDLEARLLEAEARLQYQQGRGFPSNPSSSTAPPAPHNPDRQTNSLRSRPGLERAFDPPDHTSPPTGESAQNDRSGDANLTGIPRNGRSHPASTVIEQQRPPFRGNGSSSSGTIDPGKHYPATNPPVHRPPSRGPPNQHSYSDLVHP